MENNLIIGIAILLLLTNCSTIENKQKKSTIPKVKVTEIKEVNKSDDINTTGMVKAAKNIRLSFKIGGIIENISVEEGEKVRPGQVLAKLNTQEIDARVEQANLAVEKAKRDFNRADNLYKDSVATREQWQNAKTALEAAQADLRMARFNQKHAVIRAGNHGTVLKKLAENGEITDAGYPVLVLGTNNSTHIVQTNVTDKEWVALENNDTAHIFMDAYDNKTFTARVSQISAMADPYTGTYDVELTFIDEPRKIATGMLTTVVIFPAVTHSYLRIPVDALVEADGDNGWIKIVKNNKIERRNIHIKHIAHDFLYVEGNIEQGEQAVTEGKSFVIAGQTVETIENN